MTSEILETRRSLGITVGYSRAWLGVNSLILLLVAVGDSVSVPLTQPLPIGCDRFLEASADQHSHNGQQIEPELSSEVREQKLGFHSAVHTLFLDDTVAQMAVDIGFDTVVQVLPWRDLNPSPGDFAWAVADYMVDVAQAYDLKLVVRLDMPPAWASHPEVEHGLPFEPVAYADFVSAVAWRYQGRVLGYIIWNEPNLAAEWSRSGEDLLYHWSAYEGKVADPVDYVGVLGLTYHRVKVADPGALVVTAGLAPTNENSPRAMDDRDFLRQMLDAGAADCFDVLGVHTYGFGLNPRVDRMAQDGLNLARILDLYDIMLAHGENKPVWITELGYTIGVGQHPSVTETQQADYLVEAFQHTGQEWPWVEMLTVWNLVYGRDESDEMSGYSLVAPDQSPRTAYGRLQQLLRQLGE